MSPQATLHDYDGAEPLKVKESHPLRARANNTLLGYAGPSNRDENVAVIHKTRYEDENGEQDYFRKLEAYNFDSSALELIESIGTTLIAIREIDNDRIIEYYLNQFKNSDLTRNWDGFDETNYYVPVSDAIRVWDLEECTIIKDHP